MHTHRILAIDLHPRRFGFAVLEDEKRLVGSGIKMMNSSGNIAALLQKRIHSLLAFYLPSAVVVTLGSNTRRLLRVANTKLLEIIRSETEAQSTKFVVLTRTDIRAAFRQSGNRSKDEIAAFIAGLFPDVGWKLPPRRKNYQPEYHVMTIFDAISVGLTYLVQLGQALSHHSENPHSRTP